MDWSLEHVTFSHFQCTFSQYVIIFVVVFRFVGPYTQSDFPVMKKLRERIYFEASVDTDDHRLTILARDCYATPSSNRNSNPKYWIIQKGWEKNKKAQNTKKGQFKK